MISAVQATETGCQAADSSPSERIGALAQASRELAASCDAMDFSPPVSHIYNPLSYALNAHLDYLARHGCRFAGHSGGTVFVGMNPGPWGMAQTGVPFGEVAAVRDWLGVANNTGRPDGEHPARRVQGFACHRSEVSGRRLWGLFRQRFATAEQFFAGHFVLNYCPLMFLQADANRCRNITPDKLPADEAAALFAACDGFVRLAVSALQPEYLIGIGVFAEQRLQNLFADTRYRLGRILHPSPASPASRNFAAKATEQLIALGVWEEMGPADKAADS